VFSRRLVPVRQTDIDKRRENRRRERISMTNSKVARLQGRAVIEIAGAEAADFLQGLVTSDVESLEAGSARNAALLTPQGKILFEFIVVAAGEGRFLLDCPRETAAELAKRLTFYRLRAKIDIAVRPDDAVIAIWGDGQTPPVDGAFADPRLAELGWRAIVPGFEAETVPAGCEAVDEAAYHAHRIALGVAELGSDYDNGAVFPHEADLDQLGGVDFSKGCYVGQEVVSRMQHRGTARSRFVPVTIDGAAPAVGTSIEAGGKAIGTMGSGTDGRGLALLRLDRVGTAMEAGTTITAGDASLTPEKPDWAKFDWPMDKPADAQ
jgi:tRNA-modifying protein YgfZ